jgi:hypothetical protein
MDELSRYLFLTGGVPFLVLGLAHAIATPLQVGQAKGLSPADPGLATAMAHTPVRLTRRTNVWLAWVGFNLSHSLGAVLFGVVVLLIGRSTSSFAADGGVFRPLAVIVSASYLVLAIRYWFRTPIIVCAAALALFVSSWLVAAAVTRPTSADLLALEEGWTAALRERNHDAFEKLVAEDLQHVGFEGQVVGKGEYMAFFSNGDWRYNETAGTFGFTHVWAKRGREWRVIASQVSASAS